MLGASEACGFGNIWFHYTSSGASESLVYQVLSLSAAGFLGGALDVARPEQRAGRRHWGADLSCLSAVSPEVRRAGIEPVELSLV